MRDFYFEQRFRDHLDGEKRGVLTVRNILLTLLSLYIIAWGLGLGNRDVSVLLLVFAVILIFLYHDNLKLENTTYDPEEKWVISVVGSNFSWLPPKNINENSFSIDTSKIIKIQESYDERDNNSPYYYFFESGEIVNPMINSSIKMDELIEVLKERGVTVERVSGFNRYAP